MPIISSDELARLLSIKMSVVKRIKKDLQSYEKEAEQQLKLIHGIIDDESMLKKQYQVYDETKRMLPECQQRLNVAVDDLAKFIDDNLSSLDEKKVVEAKGLISQ